MKTNREDTDQPAHLRRLIRAFSVRTWYKGSFWALCINALRGMGTRSNAGWGWVVNILQNVLAPFWKGYYPWDQILSKATLGNKFYLLEQIISIATFGSEFLLYRVDPFFRRDLIYRETNKKVAKVVSCQKWWNITKFITSLCDCQYSGESRMLSLENFKQNRVLTQ